MALEHLEEPQCVDGGVHDGFAQAVIRLRLQVAGEQQTLLLREQRVPDDTPLTLRSPFNKAVRIRNPSDDIFK